jgi:acetylornithine/N-succinyldiaminopimelate aminotransferase
LRENLEEREHRFLMQTYRRSGIDLVRGEGPLLWDSEGREYLDFLSGIAVTSLGHCNPELVEAAASQMAELDHVSNLFFSEPMVDLAESLSKGSIGGPVFLCNSGTEAIECAIKVARKHASTRGIDSPEIITFRGGFHGRSYGALSATPSMAADRSLAPMLPGFTAVEFDDPDALAAGFGPNTAAVMLETIQGEAGVFPFSPETLVAARNLTREHGALLIFDEVQVGVGRTGSLWSFQQGPVQPDLMTSSKALGGGFPIGACVASEGLGQVLEAGDHGSTFAGGPVASRVASKVLEIVDRPETLHRVRELGERIRLGLEGADGVVEVRGRGLMLGVGLAEGLEAARIRDALLQKGLILNAPRPDTLRLLPTFVMSDEQADRGAALIVEAIEGTR